MINCISVYMYVIVGFYYEERRPSICYVQRCKTIQIETKNNQKPSLSHQTTLGGF